MELATCNIAAQNVSKILLCRITIAYYLCALIVTKSYIFWPWQPITKNLKN